jgi:hypothetical protein
MDKDIGIQALNRTQPEAPLRGRKPKTWVNKIRRTDDFVKFMDQVVRKHPGQRLYVVMDHPNTPKGKRAQGWVNGHREVSFHDTPTHASWVDLVECFFSTLAPKGLQRSVLQSKRELGRFLNAFVKQYQKTCGPFVWTKGTTKLKKTIELTKKRPKKAHSR